MAMYDIHDEFGNKAGIANESFLRKMKRAGFEVDENHITVEDFFAYMYYDSSFSVTDIVPTNDR